ncbi:hypothetical protein K6U06_13675 [Acidiferrimicrobium sp. IK]|uniref:hypothetical protein n=1 Tax=Acidiferrimicrobium sp. IK TaxID=2871700 RepID=UPI0021CB5B23|nr:hypothetical protein [Acidiferrimicrobium sp. IK]MCU4185417.1 hypothetical protein [Acidiferrimicrobium sp. IK]
MSRSVDLFVDPGVDTHQLLVLLGKAARGPAVETADGRWQLRLGDQLVAHVYRHPYVDDGDLRLSRYPWVISVRVGHDGSLLDHPATAALRMVADDLRPHHCRVLLVHDLQYRLDLGGEATDVSDGRDVGGEGPDAGGEGPDAGGEDPVVEPEITQLNGAER